MVAGQHARVVYVEDEPFFSSAVNRLLIEAGYPAVVAKDGESGLETIKSELPELILLDLILPKMQGKDVLRALKADPATKDIPVIVLSNLSAEADQKEVAALGAEEYLVKAMTLPSEILERVKTRLDRPR